jgi:DNA-binding NarL/FixJ family response regulator
MIRLLVADDHAAMREKVVGVLETDYTVVGAVANGQALLEAELEYNPDVVVLDISMPILNGLEAATQLRKRSPNAKIIFLTVHEDPVFLNAAFAAGALGYVIKSRLCSDLLLAVREAMEGRRFLSPCLKLPCAAEMLGVAYSGKV